MVCKPNLVKDFCPRLPLDLDLEFVLGQAFQQQEENVKVTAPLTLYQVSKKNRSIEEQGIRADLSVR